MCNKITSKQVRKHCDQWSARLTAMRLRKQVTAVHLRQWLTTLRLRQRLNVLRLRRQLRLSLIYFRLRRPVKLWLGVTTCCWLFLCITVFQLLLTSSWFGIWWAMTGLRVRLQASSKAFYFLSELHSFLYFSMMTSGSFFMMGGVTPNSFWSFLFNPLKFCFQKNVILNVYLGYI